MRGVRSLIVVDVEADSAGPDRAVAMEMGHAVRCAENGRRVRELYAEAPPDVAVLDIIVPEEDGVEVARWVAAQGFAGRLIVTSGYSPVFAKVAALIAQQAQPGGASVASAK